MIRRLAAAATAALLAAAALGGCGIPDNTPVREDGKGPVRGYDRTGGGSIEPPVRTDSTDEAEFVANFLRAAAGESSGAYDRVKAYIAPASRDRLPERQGPDVAINIVRLTEETPSITRNPDGTSKVTISVQHVGVLRPTGVIEPPELSRSEYTFVVGKADRPADGKGLFVKEPPDELLMSAQALEDYYRPLPIYFWSKDRSALVPDLRYLPLSVPQGRQATEVRGWLIGGPADWLKDTVSALPPGTQPIGNVTQNGDRLVVNLSTEFGSANQKAELEQLGTQLAWSLRELNQDSALEIEIMIKDQSLDVFNAHDRRQANPVYAIAEPQRFCVFEGAIRPLATPGNPPIGPAPIATKLNRDIASAAFTSDGGVVRAALVTTNGSGKRLVVDSGKGSVARSSLYAKMSRPVWLRGSASSPPLGLVVVNGRLRRFDLGGRLEPVDLPGISGKVTGVAAALDGHRIAVVAGGQLYVAALVIDGRSIVAGPARLLHTSLTNLSAADWSGENTLVAAGVNAKHRVALMDITVDGTVESARVDDKGTEEVTHISAYPANPMRPGVSRIMYEVNGVAWDDFIDEPIRPDQVRLPSAAARQATSTPTAPFFLF